MCQDQKSGKIFFRLFTDFYAMHYTKRLATSFITKQTYLRVTCCGKVLNRSAGRMDKTYSISKTEVVATTHTQRLSITTQIRSECSVMHHP